MFSVDISSLQWFETVCRYLELRGGGLGVETVLTKGTAATAMVALKLAGHSPASVLIPSIEAQNGVH